MFTKAIFPECKNKSPKLVPKLRFGKALAGKAPALRVPKLVPKLRFACKCVPKPELGNKKLRKQRPASINTQSRSFACKCVPKPELGNEKNVSRPNDLQMFTKAISPECKNKAERFLSELHGLHLIKD
jgi:hypothetical protein